MEIFDTLFETKVIIARWSKEYNSNLKTCLKSGSWSN